MQHSREGLLAVHAAVLIFGFTALFLGEWLTLNVVLGGLIVVSAAMFESLPKKPA